MQEFVEVYVNDKYDLKIKEWFKSLNPDAYARIVKKILEANRKGYFKTDEQTLKKLVKLYKELETQYSISKDYNEKFKKFVNDKAIGFGLMTPDGKMVNQVSVKMKKPKTQKQAKANTPPKVKGQKLEKQIKQEVQKSYREYVVFAFLLLIMIGGVVYEFRKKGYRYG